MVTNYRKDNLIDMFQGNHEMYNTFSLIGDKLRSIYQLFGWTHMLTEFADVDNVVENLTNHAIETLINGATECTVASVGLIVHGFIDEDGYLNLDYSFNLI